MVEVFNTKYGRNTFLRNVGKKTTSCDNPEDNSQHKAYANYPTATKNVNSEKRFQGFLEKENQGKKRSEMSPLERSWRWGRTF
jgi:hypothetical protein